MLQVIPLTISTLPASSARFFNTCQNSEYLPQGVFMFHSFPNYKAVCFLTNSKKIAVFLDM
jgi:hypothetical protein